MRTKSGSSFPFLAVIFIVLGFMSVSWDEAIGYTASGTIWCSDETGRNFKCGTRNTETTTHSSGGGGCASSGGGDGYSSSVATSNRAIRAFNAGNAENRKGNYEAAINYYQRSLEIDPSATDARKNMGLSQASWARQMFDKGNIAFGMQLYEKAVQNYPHESLVHNIKVFRERYPEHSSVPVEGKGRGCSACNKALINDVDYGLGSSARIRTYVSQSLRKYENCLASIMPGCKRTCEYQFYDKVEVACNNKPTNSSFKACVETMVRGVRSAC